MEHNLPLPSVKYLKFGNIYSGSSGNFNYKIFPNVKEEKFKISTWLGKCCYEKCDVLHEKDFKLNEVGLNEAAQWLSQLLK